MKDPLLSLVVPTRNRPNALSRLLASLSRTTYLAHGCVVHVVADRTPYDERFVERFSSMADVHFHLSPSRGPAAARNLGASFARSTFVAFLDDDCVAPPAFIDDVVTVLKAEPRTMVAIGGPVRPLDASGGSAITRYLAAVKHLDGPITSSGAIVNMASANLCVRLEAFRAVGGFDERFRWAGGEDQYLLATLRGLGTLVFSAGFFLYHDHDISLIQFARKFFRYGRGVALNDCLTSYALPLDTNYRPTVFRLRDFRRCFRTIRSLASERLSHIDPSRLERSYGLLSIIQEMAFQLGYNSQSRHLRKPQLNGPVAASA